MINPPLPGHAREWRKPFNLFIAENTDLIFFTGFKIGAVFHFTDEFQFSFIQDNILKKFKTTGVQPVLDWAVFNLLKYIAVFPGGVNKLEDKDGNVLPDCFLLPPNSTALSFAYKLHTDLGKNFIRAIDVRTKRTVGKEHLLKHRDLIEVVAGK